MKTKIFFAVLLFSIFLSVFCYGFIYIKNRGDRPKDQLRISPDGQKIGYFLDLNYFTDEEKNKEINFIDYDNYTALVIMNKDGSDKKEIYRGDYHTSYWEWLDNNDVIVYHDCGTECMTGLIIDANTGKRKVELFYGVDYQWSPSKKLVMVYHYSSTYGITVGDKFGNDIFNLRREKGKIYSKLIEETKGEWSPDNKKIALIIKKKNQEKLELLVFDVENNFKTIYRMDWENNFLNLSWRDNNTISYEVNNQLKEITVK